MPGAAAGGRSPSDDGGFRRAYHAARGEGWVVNHKKVQRLWREEGLRVPQRRGRKHLGTSTTVNTLVADAPNRLWAIDFQFDATTDGRTVKIASIVMNTPANAWVGSSTALLPLMTSSPSWTASPTTADTRRRCAAIMGPSWRVRLWLIGPRVGWCCALSRPVSRGGTAMSSVSTAESATNA